MTDLDFRIAVSSCETGATGVRPPTRRRRRWIGWGVAVLLVLGVGLVGVRMWLTAPARKISVQETIDKYRDESSGSSSAAASSGNQVRLPATGVYVYDTPGQESVDALGGDTHAYPSESAMTVLTEGCGSRVSWGPARRTVRDIAAVPARRRDLLPPWVTNLLGRGVDHQPFVNLVVTNVPGPPFPLYAMGARMLEAIPVVPLGGNMPLEVAILSYDGVLTISVTSDVDTCPDVDAFVEGVERGLRELGAGWHPVVTRRTA